MFRPPSSALIDVSPPPTVCPFSLFQFPTRDFRKDVFFFPGGVRGRFFCPWLYTWFESTIRLLPPPFVECSFPSHYKIPFSNVPLKGWFNLALAPAIPLNILLRFWFDVFRSELTMVIGLESPWPFSFGLFLSFLLKSFETAGRRPSFFFLSLSFCQFRLPLSLLMFFPSPPFFYVRKLAKVFSSQIYGALFLKELLWRYMCFFYRPRLVLLFFVNGHFCFSGFCFFVMLHSQCEILLLIYISSRVVCVL